MAGFFSWRCWRMQLKVVRIGFGEVLEPDQDRNYFVRICKIAFLLLIFFVQSPLILANPEGGVGGVHPSKPWRWMGKRLHHGGDICVLVFS